MSPNGKPSRVLANNGKESELYTSLLSVPFIENGAESIDLYGKLISLDFLKEKHIQDDNGEPKLYFMAGNSNVNPLFESFANAKIAYPNSPIIAGFAKYGKLQEYNNRSYAPMNQFTPIASFANILSDVSPKATFDPSKYSLNLSSPPNTVRANSSNLFNRASAVLFPEDA